MERMLDDDLESRLIEGVSNSVIYLLTAVTGFIIPMFIMLWNRRHQALQSIHPLSESLVGRIRGLLGVVVGNGEPTHTPIVTQETPAYNSDQNCPICFAQSRYATQTNCGHVFCGPCLITYWRHGSWLSNVLCPVCRAQVTLLLKSFVETDEDAQRITRDINEYNRRFSGQPRPWIDYVYDLPVLIPHLFNQLFSMGGIMLIFRIRVICCVLVLILYVLSPLDIIPESVFGLFGLLDDLFIAFMILVYITIIYRNMLANAN